MHSDIWIAGHELRKKGNQWVQSPEHGGAHPQGADRLLVRRNRSLCFCSLLQNPSTGLQENDALVRKTGATSRTVQKRGTKPLFEAQIRAAHAALAHAKLVCCCRKTPCIGDCLKCLHFG